MSAYLFITNNIIIMQGGSGSGSGFGGFPLPPNNGTGIGIGGGVGNGATGSILDRVKMFLPQMEQVGNI